MTQTIKRAEFERTFRIVYPHPPRPLVERLVEVAPPPVSRGPLLSWGQAANALVVVVLVAVGAFGMLEGHIR